MLPVYDLRGGSGCDLSDLRTVLVVDVGVLMEEIFSPERAGFR